MSSLEEILAFMNQEAEAPEDNPLLELPDESFLSQEAPE